MAERINMRLIQMAREREPVAKMATGTALVVIKNRVVQEAFDRLELKFGKGLCGRRAGHPRREPPDGRPAAT